MTCAGTLQWENIGKCDAAGSALLFPEKMKITAVPAIPQSLGTGKAYLFQTAVCHIINIAKQAAQFLTAVFLAGCK